MVSNNKMMATRKKKNATISPEKLKQLQQELKELNMQWVPLLVTKIKTDKTIDKAFKGVNDRKVYNVFNGIVKNGAWKVVVYGKGSELKEELQSKLQQVVN